MPATAYADALTSPAYLIVTAALALVIAVAVALAARRKP